MRKRPFGKNFDDTAVGNLGNPPPIAVPLLEIRPRASYEGMVKMAVFVYF